MCRPAAPRFAAPLLAALLCAADASLGAQGIAPGAHAIDSIAGAAVAQNRVIGTVVAVVRGKDTLLMKGYGKANLEWDVPMPADAMFEIGSVSKQFAAASILKLRDAGTLGLDDDITKWLPGVTTGPHRVTLRHLLSHTSGIFAFSDQDDFELNYFAPRFPRDSAARFIKLEPFGFPTGTAQAYSNSGYWLLGLVVEKASGMKYEDYLQKEIFAPLGMSRSMYCNTAANVHHRAAGYSVRGPGQLQRAPQFNYTWVFAPGALCSTAGDLITWLTALHGGKVLSPASYAEMTTPAKLDDGTPLRYGYGLKVTQDYGGLRYIGHGGTAPGFRADAAWYPDSRMAVVVLMNTSPSPVLPQDVSTAIARELTGWKRPTLGFFTGDAAPFIGTYELAVGGQGSATITVGASPQGLTFSVNGSPPRPLPWAGGMTFHTDEFTTLTFRRANGGTGPVTELRRDNMNNHAILKKR